VLAARELAKWNTADRLEPAHDMTEETVVADDSLHQQPDAR
jgi:hypothetical protein